MPDHPSYNTLLISGALDGASMVTARAMVDEYERLHTEAARMITAEGLQGNMQAAYRTIERWSHPRPIIRSEWYIIHSQAWHDVTGRVPRIPSCPGRMIIPTPTRIAYDGTTEILWGNHRWRLVGTWRGAEHPVWRDIATIPSSISAITITPPGAVPVIELSIYIYNALVRDAADFAAWLYHGIRLQKEGHKAWVPNK